jgi:Fe-S-cluster containining protein|tara:strand:- start:420 stop:734 length:315 start_codon:yes stop_codon:yes gene_type:complete
MECSTCGVCCSLFLINLTEQEYMSGKYKLVFEEFGLVDFEEAELTGANILKQKDDESCIYLNENKCSIHHKRPAVCRDFFCESKEDRFKSMIQKINLKKNESIQ